MKNFFSACILLFIACSSNGQLSKKQFLVGGFGDFSYSSQSDKVGLSDQTNKLTALSISVDGGYFIIDRLCAGLRFTGSLNNLNQHASYTGYAIGVGGGTPDTVFTVNNTTYVSKIHSYGFSPFVRYYFLRTTHKINLLAELSYSHSFDASGYNSASETYSYSGGSGPPQYSLNTNVSLIKTQSNAAGIRAGPAIFFNSKVSMEVLLGWEYLTSSHITTNSFTIGAGFHVHLNAL